MEADEDDGDDEEMSDSDEAESDDDEEEEISDTDEEVHRLPAACKYISILAA